MKHNFIDITGKRYGYLTVVKYLRTDKAKNGATVWLCRCACGIEKEYTKAILVSRRIHTCGCGRYVRRKITRDEYAFNQIRNHYKTSARKRGLSWGLSDTDLRDFLRSSCAYCGLKGTAIFKFRGCNFQYTGIDRKDNDEGYWISNCVPSCNTCNRAKHTLSMDRWKLYLESVAAKQIFGQLRPIKVVKKVWGTEHWLTNNESYCTKILELDGGTACSLHMHPIKRETFTVILGCMDLESRVDGIKVTEKLKAGDSRTIEVRTFHRFSSRERAFVLETSTHHDDADVVRIEESRRID